TVLRLIYSSLFFFTLPPPPRSPLFPYTTLFRSRRAARVLPRARRVWRDDPHRRQHSGADADARAGHLRPRTERPRRRGGRAGVRSEEHTSELQSRENLVCRLLLEKKKKKEKPTT